MSDPHDPVQIEKKLRAAAKGARAGMLGIVGGAPHHFHPMRAYLVDEEKPFWFICRREVQLVQDLGGDSHAAMFMVVSEDHHLHASIGGTLREDREQGRIDQFWSSLSDAWMPEGKTSPNVTLLRFDPADAMVWLSDNSFKLAFEVAKANYNRTEITSGETVALKLD